MSTLQSNYYGSGIMERDIIVHSNGLASNVPEDKQKEKRRINKVSDFFFFRVELIFINC